VIHKHRVCWEALARGYDTCGAQFGENIQLYQGEVK